MREKRVRAGKREVGAQARSFAYAQGIEEARSQQLIDECERKQRSATASGATNLVVGGRAVDGGEVNPLYHRMRGQQFRNCFGVRTHGGDPLDKISGILFQHDRVFSEKWRGR